MIVRVKWTDDSQSSMITNTKLILTRRQAASRRLLDGSAAAVGCRYCVLKAPKSS